MSEPRRCGCCGKDLDSEVPVCRMVRGILTPRGAFRVSDAETGRERWFHEECFRAVALSPDDVLRELQQLSKKKRRA